MGSILTAAMMLEHLNLNEAARAVENAVIACVRDGQTTRDAGGNLGTREAGDAVLARL
jgi:isocitrate/isopropylmalate dehydrogenase